MKKTLRLDLLVIFLLISLNMAIGTAIFSDYGESWDETRLHEYADQSLNAYHALFDRDIQVDFGNDDLRYYGPVYLMTMSLLVQGANRIFPNVPAMDLWHLGNFICLQLGLVCFYFLLRRFMRVISALATTILFASQPLIWGHAFINPKDIPFMAFFTASVFCGLRMLDDFEGKNFQGRALFRSTWFYLAALTLGVTISIRVLGFAAAAIVLGYFAFINSHKVLRLSYLYLGSALIVALLTWPYLWPSPIVNFLQGIYAILKFQWVGQTLFNGIYYHSDQLPWNYVPQLLLMQLTEPALLLFMLGLVLILAKRLLQRYKQILILFLFWFVIPMLYILVLGMNLYDNTRQLLFLFPGAFLMIAIALDLLFHWIKPIWAQALVLLAVILPGVAGIIQYHPYEYTYYNFSTTSSLPIFRNFETDYWATSYKQAAQYLNANAPENSLVIAGGPGRIIQHYARPDLDVLRFDDVKTNAYTAHPFYLVLPTRYDLDQEFYPDIRPVYSVRLNDSVLAVVKYIAPQK